MWAIISTFECENVSWPDNCLAIVNNIVEKGLFKKMYADFYEFFRKKKYLGQKQPDLIMILTTVLTACHLKQISFY